MEEGGDEGEASVREMGEAENGECHVPAAETRKADRTRIVAV